MILHFRLLAAALLLVPGVFAGAATARVRPPNIVLILADDLGYGDLGCYGASRVATPRIDRLAAKGVRFTDAHAPGAVCVPSRYGLLTGRYPFRVEGMSTRNGPVIEAGRMTIASLLQESGFATAMVGKWHQGFEGGNDFDYTQPLRGGPVDRGFASFFGIHASTDIPPYFYIRNDRVVAAPTIPLAASHTPGWSPVQGAFWREGLIAPDMDLAAVLPDFTREAVARIGELQGRAEPFFLYVALAAPHTPWLPDARFQGKSGAGLYGDFVMHVDHAVGEILDALQKSGRAEDTLVIFASDNGPVWRPADRERFGHSATGIHRGMKGDAWEGGHRVPFVARWPGRIQPGTVNAETISLVDLLATFAALVDRKLPAHAGEDSFDLLPLLLGQRATLGREATVVLSARGTPVIRQGRWKLIPALGSRGLSEPRLVEPEPGQPTGQLFDLAADPGETKDRWAERPEVVAQLQGIFDRYRATGRSRSHE